MANGQIHKLGTLYMGATKVSRPTRPWLQGGEPYTGAGGGNIVSFNAGSTLTIQDTEATDADKMQWVEVNDGDKKYLVGDRVMLVEISWDDLNAQDLIFGKEVTIDSQQYLLRSLTGGSDARNNDNYAGGSPTNNEWDQWIVNESGLSGLPTPTSADLGTSAYQSSSVMNDTHNSLWNWGFVHSWAQETYVGNGSFRAIRGNFSARYWDSLTSSARYVAYGWRPVLEVLNASPTLTLNTTDSQTLYENDTFTIDGTASDSDNGNVVTTRYRIEGHTSNRAIKAEISDGVTPIPFSKELTFKEGALYDGNTIIANDLQASTTYTLTVFAEDDQGGQSTLETRTFNVVPNRAPQLTIDSFAQQTDRINADTFTISGTANDPDDGNTVTVSYRLNGSSAVEVYSGKPGAWSFDLDVGNLVEGENTIAIEAVDTYDFQSSKTLRLNKAMNATPLLESVARYNIESPTGTASGILLWIEREEGLTIDVDVSMTNTGEAEDYVNMTLTNSAPVRTGTVEDEFVYEVTEAKENIVVKITMTREDDTTSDAITMISGVLE